MRDDGEAVVDFSSHLLSGDGADISLPEAAEDLDLPLFAVLGDSSEAWASSAAGLLNFVLAPDDYLIIISDTV